ncbi:MULTISPECIES: flagellar biosynthetic protein FliR [Methylosinus]|uniref:flagellar biosynthetic protein FliR n=1 Tax=Methylosinus TaxID=425 RepID=UPI0001D2EE7F|nr:MULTISPECIES: flagellar biosynthetic protein FliR [Methylosinus]OBS54214.1 flagellar biosynthetic protein FliR [Methylosinus sp. 3S-1]
MTLGVEALAATLFVLFCRIGGCIMAMPGFSSPRIPVQARLYIAIAITIALAPRLVEVVAPIASSASATGLAVLLVGELLVGVLIGSLARLFFFALETLATAGVTAAGLGNVLGAPMEEAEPLPAMSSFIMLGATALIFLLDLHWEMVRGVFLSYTAIPIRDAFQARNMLSEYTKVLTQAFLVALRISSPLLLFGLIVNLAFGFLNRMTPQVPVFFVSTPLLIGLGCYWFYLMADDFFAAFISSFGSWLLTG